MIIHNQFEQGSGEWLEMRAGKITASEADALVTSLGHIKQGDAVKTYLIQKLAERWSGRPMETPNGIFDIEQGQFLEEQARPAFTLHTNIETERVGFVESEDGAYGCSPDALIYDGNGMILSGVEIKCPKLETHIRYLLDGKLPTAYVAQVQFSMFVTCAFEWHFFSYRRKLPPFHLVVKRDSDYQANISAALAAFLDSLDHAFEKLCRLNGGPPPKPKSLLAPANPVPLTEAPSSQGEAGASLNL